MYALCIFLDDIRSEYERIRQENILRSDEKRSKIYSDYPELKELDFKIFSTVSNIFNSSKDSEKAIHYTDELEKYRGIRIDYLKEHNIKDDYREVEYTCKKCRDTGFINGKKCSCYIEKEIELLDNISNFKKYIEDDNFDKLDMSYYKQNDIKNGT